MYKGIWSITKNKSSRHTLHRLNYNITAIKKHFRELLLVSSIITSCTLIGDSVSSGSGKPCEAATASDVQSQMYRARCTEPDVQSQMYSAPHQTCRCQADLSRSSGRWLSSAQPLKAWVQVVTILDKDHQWWPGSVVASSSVLVADKIQMWNKNVVKWSASWCK